jgi:hypothetical protein
MLGLTAELNTCDGGRLVETLAGFEEPIGTSGSGEGEAFITGPLAKNTNQNFQELARCSAQKKSLTCDDH